MSVKVIGLQSLTILPHDQQELLAKAYQSIYGAHPWNEQWKCDNPDCSAYWGSMQKSEVEELNFRHCDNHAIVPYWPTEDRLHAFKELSSMPRFCATIAYDSGNIVGFCWAYQFSDSGILESKMEAPGLASIITSMQGPTAYLADLAVEPEYRGTGVARMLTQLRCEQMIKMGFENVFTRTKNGPNQEDRSVTDLWYEKAGIPIVFRYNDARCRVIRANKLSKIIW